MDEDVESAVVGDYYVRIESFDKAEEGRRILRLEAILKESSEQLLSPRAVIGEHWDALTRGEARDTRLYRNLETVDIQIEVGANDEWAPDRSDPSWFTLTLGAAGIAEGPSIPALVTRAGGEFSGLESPMHVLTNSTPPKQVEGDTAALLDDAFSIDHWGTASVDDVAAALAGLPGATQVVVFDVGQGSAIGLVDDTGVPFLYVDLGRGFAGDSDNVPDDLSFCFHHENRPVIVLSHWHKDHWFGSTHAPESLSSTWIVPKQKVGSGAFALGEAILDADPPGRILVVESPDAITAALDTDGPAQRITIQRLRGPGFNDSGLGVVVEREAQGRHPKTAWLLVGDGAYSKVATTPARVSVLVASHHGGDQDVVIVPPPRPKTGYARLLYSFGPDNEYKHPDLGTVDLHKAAGWTHAKAGDGDTWPAGGNMLSTATPLTPGTRSAIAAGWTAIPPVATHLTTTHGFIIRS